METGAEWKRTMKQKRDEVPLSESNVSLKLADIQKRCSELLSDPNELDSLSLEDPVVVPDESNPYSRG